MFTAILNQVISMYLVDRKCHLDILFELTFDRALCWVKAFHSAEFTHSRCIYECATLSRLKSKALYLSEVGINTKIRLETLSD